MTKQIIAVVMGSDSDLSVMREALEMLEEFDIPFGVRVLSAHRTPGQTAEFAKNAIRDGVKVIITAAGGAAHLAGVIASMVTIPVIGVPILTKTLSGVDSLYSIVQMPPGVPVATVGINSAKNAVILALQIIALNDRKLARQLQSYKQKLERAVVNKDHKLASIGWRNYGS